MIKRLFVPAMLLWMGITGCNRQVSTPAPPPTEQPAPQPTEIQIVIDSFDSCAAAGNPVMESYPRQCRGPDGALYTEDIGNELDKLDLIQVNTPRPNAVIRSPLVIEGQARGTWFFEADFPIELRDQNGTVLGTAIATAQGEWMTEDFVPFSASLTFTAPAEGRGWLILIKDNPSDLPELDDALEIPVNFSAE